MIGEEKEEECSEVGMIEAKSDPFGLS